MWTHGDTKILHLTVGVTVSFGGFECPGARNAENSEHWAGLRRGYFSWRGPVFRIGSLLADLYPVRHTILLPVAGLRSVSDPILRIRF